MTSPTIDPFSGEPYTLNLLAESGDLKHYRIAIEGSRLQSTDIVFTADHIAIFGDLCPGRHGVASCLGYGLPWFSTPKGARYLAEKFLSTSWHQDLARTELDAMVADRPGDFQPSGGGFRDDRAAVVRHLHGMIDDYDVRRFADWFTDHGFESEDIPGHGYDPRDLRLLHDINHRFAALYAAKEDEMSQRDIAIATAKSAAGLAVDITKTAAARDRRGWWVHLRTGPGGSYLGALVWVPDVGPAEVERL